MQPTSCPGNITPCASTAGNCWTRPKRSSAAQKMPPSADNQERAPTGKYIGTGGGGSRTIRRCESLSESDDLKDSELVRSRKAAAPNLLGARPLYDPITQSGIFT